MEFLHLRDTFGPDYTLGALYKGDVRLGELAEDTDRYLELHPEAKIYGRTAIPCGRYELDLTLSKRWGKLMPEIIGVPNYSGVRYHGGNLPFDPAGVGHGDSQGCPLLGLRRSRMGVYDCKEVNYQLIEILRVAKLNKESCWVTVTRASEWKGFTS